MKYQVSLFCIIITAQIAAINLSGLLSDSNQVVKTTTQTESQPSISSQQPAELSTSDLPVATTESQTNQAQQNVVTPKRGPINLSGLLSANSSVKSVQVKQRSLSKLSALVNYSDPDYQKAINILNNLQNSRIYDDYLESIRQYFIDYYLVHVQAVKIVKKPKVINLSALELLSNSKVVQKKAQQLSQVNLSSLVQIGNVRVTKIPLQKKVVNLSLLADSTNSKVKKIEQPKHSIVNLSSLQRTQPVQVMDASKSQPSSTQSDKKKKRVSKINLSSLLNN